MRNALFALAAVAPILGIALYRFGLLAALTPIFISHLLLLYPTLTPNSQWWGPVVRSFATDEQEVWLTIDDGPSPSDTVALLDVLDRFDARATFFVIGERAEKHPHLVTEILTRGHEVANHTFTHPSAWFWSAGPRATAREIDRCTPALRSTTERPARFFRPPAGLKNPFLHPALARRGLCMIGWTARGFDTLRRDPARVASAIAKHVRRGAIILLHEGHHASAFHARCLELTLAMVSERGYRCVIPEPQQLRFSAAGK